jgi:sugar O-acyltransferase (sialic acid O-acetyltransferase NeuD family)
MMHKVIIYGTRDLAELAHLYLTSDSEYEVVAFTVEDGYRDIETFKGLPVLSWEDLTPSDAKLFIPVSDNNVRRRLYTEAKHRSFDFATYISSRCTNLATSVGQNCFIFEDNTLQPFTTIGNNVILWSGNHIGHHGRIEDNVFFTSHVVMSGHCTIQDGAFLGVNSAIRDGVTIAKNSVIGMGSTVTKDTKESGIYFGSPAKWVRYV